MKKWGFLLILLLFLGVTAVKIAAFSQDKVEIQRNAQNHKVNLNYQNKMISNVQIYQGNLLLVNSEYQVHEEAVKSDIVNLYEHADLTKGYGLLNNEIYLPKKLAEEFMVMIDAAAKEGVSDFLISSGYRNFKEQDALYQKMSDGFALPAGYSEHNLGLSLDVGSTQHKMSEAPEGKWIEKNAWKYGFILRYPKDKSDITGIQYEPWHIRYVGLPHSAIIQENNFVLEEYLDYLEEVKNISVNINGKKYVVSYYPFSQGMLLKVPTDRHYEISGNNIDGVIVTEYE